jgi:hypothetical protein
MNPTFHISPADYSRWQCLWWNHSSSLCLNIKRAILYTLKICPPWINHMSVVKIVCKHSALNLRNRTEIHVTHTPIFLLSYLTSDKFLRCKEAKYYLIIDSRYDIHHLHAITGSAMFMVITIQNCSSNTVTTREYVVPIGTVEMPEFRAR